MRLTQLVQTPPGGLVVSINRDATGTIVALRGEADAFTVGLVVDVLDRAVNEFDGPVTVDLGRTEFIDAATVRALAIASERLAGRGRTLMLRSPSRMATKVLGLLGLSERIERVAATV